ncbi:MAG: hypothetical protein R2843_10310 [Thermomicrobiales bacterium]
MRSPAANVRSSITGRHRNRRGGIVGGNTIGDIKPCSFSGPVPGMAADVVDEQRNWYATPWANS